MKKYIYATLVAGAALFLVGCSDDEMEQMSIKHPGEEIAFGGRAGFEVSGDEANVKTRTVYTGNVWTEKDETGATKSYEGVNWVSGDKVRIFCEEANGTKVADYTVNATNTDAIKGTEKHEVGLTKIGNVGLQWSNATDYEFFAVYPSPHQYPLNSDNSINQTYADGVLNNSTTVSGTIPTVQTPLKRVVDNDSNYVFAPRMEYAYMVARQQFSSLNNSSAVNLNFTPIATAVEIELYNGITGYNEDLATLLLTNILISAKDENTIIAGDFNADLSKLTDGNGDKSFCGIPESGFVTTGTNTYKQITIPVFKDGLYGDPTPLKPGKSIKFTVFMLPTQNINDLNVTIQGATGSATGKTTGITVKMHKKTYLQKMPITNTVMPFDQSRWIEYLPDNAYIEGLSIPGAGGATSGYVTKTDDNEYYLEQSLNIPGLWNHGIRCFEFSVDRSMTNGGDLGEQEIYNNTIPTGIKLKDAIASVKTKLIENPNEFATVIITYQANKGWETRDGSSGEVSNTNNRNSQEFMNQLNSFWTKVGGNEYSAWPQINGIQTGVKLYSQNLTIEDARGKLFCIARPTSEGEDNYVEITEHSSGLFVKDYWYTLSKNTLSAVNAVNENILVIHGWGALKDKWEARGFTPCIFQRGVGNSAFKQALNHGKYEIFYNKDIPGRPFDVSKSSVAGLAGTLDQDKDSLGNNIDGNKYVSSKIKTLQPNFYYDVQAGTATKTSNGAWVQEWARVSPEGGIKGGSGTNFAWWPSSYEEKKERIKECLDYSLKKNINGVDANNVIFINSLCGYYIDINIWTSCEPNSLTEANLANREWSSDLALSPLTNASATSGMCGDIATFATNINTFFYGYLKQTIEESSYTPGSMGIILMDRIGQDAASTQIPSIIIANNFHYALPSKPVTISEIKKSEDPFNSSTETPLAKPRNSEGGMTITWE